ncbi:hypothetical protein MASR2M70_05210 [Bacillota bacterium]
MKVFIVFLALLIVNTTFISFAGDLNRYVRLQTYLKAAAEEAAAGAALYYDEEAFGRGIMIINRDEGEKYIADQIARVEASLNLKEGESLRAEVEIEDDMGGSADPGVTPAVTVTLCLTVTDLFRLPFVCREQVVRSARYELAEY